MDLSEDIRPVTYMKMQSADLVRRVRRTRRPLVITQNGEAKVVVLDVATYQKLRDASLMARLMAQSEEDIRAGRTAPQEDVFSEIEADFGPAEPKRRKFPKKRR